MSLRVRQPHHRKRKETQLPMFRHPFSPPRATPLRDLRHVSGRAPACDAPPLSAAHGNRMYARLTMTALAAGLLLAGCQPANDPAATATAESATHHLGKVALKPCVLTMWASSMM